MKYIVTITCLCILVVSCSFALAAPAGIDILTKAMSLHKSVRDYTATVQVTTNLPDVEIPDRTAKVYVKPPDKAFVESRGIVFIPKRALLFGDLAKEIGKGANVTLIGTSKSGGKTVYALKIIPKNPPQNPPQGKRPGSTGTPRILTWVNGSNWTLQKMEVYDGAKLAVRVNFSYIQTQGVWMPAKVSASVPKGVLGSASEGRVELAFSNYKLNVGLTDEFFKKKEAEQARTRQRQSPHRPRHPMR